MAEPGSVFKKVDYDVAGLLHYIDLGDIGLPDIQRPFVWSATKVRDLALVEWPDNSDISDDSPATYWPPMAQCFVAKDGTTAELGQMCYWHALTDRWETTVYADFLTARRRAMARVIRDGFERLNG